MGSNIKEIQKKINQATKELDLAIANGEEYDEIVKISQKVDKIIMDYLYAENDLKEQEKELLAKYNDLIETPFKNEVIGEIRKEVRLKYPAIGIKELLMFSTNVYILTTLLAHNVPEQDAIDQLIFLNNKFFNIMQNQDDVVVNREMTNFTLDYLTYIKDKYIKVIKERI